LKNKIDNEKISRNIENDEKEVEKI